MLISNEPGVTSQPFVMQAAAITAAAGRPVVYFATDRPPKRVMMALQDYTSIAAEQITIIDGFSSLHGIPEEGYMPVDISNVAQVLARLQQAHHDQPDALFILDSLNGLVMRADLGQLAAAGPALRNAIQAFPESIVAYTQWHEELVLRPILDAFPHHIRLSAVQDRIITHHYYRLERISGHVADLAPVMYRENAGKVQIYIPKIGVTGPGDAGKSTFIHQVSDSAVSVERNGKTVAMDKGTLTRKGLRVDIFGTPGQARFDPLIAPILRNAIGLVLMVDSRDPDSFPRARQMLTKAWREGMQVVIAVNKVDLEGALSVEEVVAALDPPGDPLAIECQAIDAASAINVLDSLLERILASPEVHI
jgi:small GTP-binding protein